MAHAPATTASTEFFLHVSRVPDGYTWQDLKDIVRRVASHGIWADIREFENGRHGGVKVKLYGEALQLYSYLDANGLERQRVHVALWNTTGPPAAFIMCNGNHDHSIDPRQISGFLDSPRWAQPSLPDQTISSAYSTYSTIQYPAPPIPMNGSVYPTLQSMGQPSQYYAQTPRQSLQYPQMQQYPPLPTMNSCIPINTDQGVVTVEPRGVLVTNLDHRLNEADIRNRFSLVGAVTSCRIAPNKSSATVKYRTYGEARMACEQLHGENMRGRYIAVRLTRDAEPVQTPRTGNSSTRSREPVVVDGSETSGRRNGRSNASRV